MKARQHRPTLLFDLDGTLVDTLADLTTALNRLRDSYRLPPLAASEVAGMVGDGAGKLVQRGLPESCRASGNLGRFLDYYRQHLCEQTVAYPGIVDLLEEFSCHAKAVVTNKPFALASELLRRLGLAAAFNCVIGGDSYAEKKPHPLPLLKTLEILHCAPDQAIMIGDHHTDLLAGRAAGCRTCFCRWGFGNQGSATTDWVVADPVQLAGLLRDLSF